MGDDTMIGIGTIVVIVVGFLFMREQWIKTKRTMHNAKRSILEVRDINDIAAEEEAKRAVNGMLGIREKKSGGGFVKGLIWLVIIGVVLYFIFGGN
jgi:hypothetical protein